MPHNVPQPQRSRRVRTQRRGWFYGTHRAGHRGYRRYLVGAPASFSRPRTVIRLVNTWLSAGSSQNPRAGQPKTVSILHVLLGDITSEGMPCSTCGDMHGKSIAPLLRKPKRSRCVTRWQWAPRPPPSTPPHLPNLFPGQVFSSRFTRKGLPLGIDTSMIYSLGTEASFLHERGRSLTDYNPKKRKYKRHCSLLPIGRFVAIAKTDCQNRRHRTATSCCNIKMVNTSNKLRMVDSGRHTQYHQKGRDRMSTSPSIWNMRAGERLDGGKRGTHRVPTDVGEEQQEQRGSHKRTLGVVQPGQEREGEEDGDRDAAGPALRPGRAYPCDNPRINQELKYEHASATRRQGLQQ